MRAPIQSVKHIIQQGFTVDTAGTASALIFATGKTISDMTGAAADVAEGSLIKAVWVEMWIQSASSQPGSVILIVEKIPAGQSTASTTQLANLNDYPNKKNVFYTTQGLVGDANTNPTPFIRQWIKIPKSKQRTGLGDNWSVTISTIVENQNKCGAVIYKSVS